MNMKKQGKSKTGGNPVIKKQDAGLRTPNKLVSPGVTQPHNAKKEALGPNTDRNA